MRGANCSFHAHPESVLKPTVPRTVANAADEQELARSEGQAAWEALPL